MDTTDGRHVGGDPQGRWPPAADVPQLDLADPGQGLSLGLGFLAWLVAARLFDAADVGLAAAIVAAMMLCVQLSLIGVGSSIINLFPAQQHAPARLFDTAFSVVGLAALAVGAVFLVLAVTLLRELRIVATDPVFAVCSSCWGSSARWASCSTRSQRWSDVATRRCVATSWPVS
jgi:hypothetical protein